MLLHGGNTNSAMWLRSLSAWSRHFRIYAVDIIGDPGFSATTRLPLQTDDHTQWLDDVLKSLNLRNADIIGASFGGWIALRFAIHHSTAVNRLVLLAPAGIARVSIAATLEISALMLMGAWGRRRALLRLFGLSNAKLTDDQESFLAFGSVVQLNSLSRLKVPAPIPDEQLSMLSARTLAVLGGRDILFNADEVRKRLRELCPGVMVSTIPDAGNGLVEPTEIVLEFLSTSRVS